MRKVVILVLFVPNFQLFFKYSYFAISIILVSILSYYLPIIPTYIPIKCKWVSFYFSSKQLSYLLVSYFFLHCLFPYHPTSLLSYLTSFLLSYLTYLLILLFPAFLLSCFPNCLPSLFHFILILHIILKYLPTQKYQL